MNIIQTKILPRADIAQFMPTPRAIIAFEALQKDTTNQYDVLSTGQFLTLDSEPALGAERVLTLTAGDLVAVDGGPNSAYTISLAPSGVTAGGYGGAAYTLAMAVDVKGRITSITAYALNTSNITEGSNLYYTTARAIADARSALSASSGVSYNSSTGAFKAVSAGTYGAPSGSVSRSTFSSYTPGVTLTFSATYVQAEHTAVGARLVAIEAALQTLSQVLAALVTDLKANGNLT